MVISGKPFGMTLDLNYWINLVLENLSVATGLKSNFLDNPIQYHMVSVVTVCLWYFMPVPLA